MREHMPIYTNLVKDIVFRGLEDLGDVTIVDLVGGTEWKIRRAALRLDQKARVKVSLDMRERSSP